MELTEIRTSAQDWWSLALEAAGPVGLLRSQLQATAAHAFAQAPARRATRPGSLQVLSRSGLASGPAPAMKRALTAVPAPSDVL